MDILLSLRNDGYNLLDTEDPATLGMPVGRGYTLRASINSPWVFTFNDGTQTHEYPLESNKLLHTSTKDSLKLWRKYTKLCKEAGVECKFMNSVQDGSPVSGVEDIDPVCEEDADQIDRAEYEERERAIIEMDLREKQKEETVPPSRRYNIDNVIKIIDELLGVRA